MLPTSYESLRNLSHELRNLGPRGTLFLLGKELKGRIGLSDALMPVAPTLPRNYSADHRERLAWTAQLPFADPASVANAMRDRIAPESIAALRTTAEEASRGRIVCFGRWTADFGNPIDWHRDPVTGAVWDPHLPAARALSAASASDVKFTWEVARFPHAYHMARAAAFVPGEGPALATALTEQVASFIRSNPFGKGIHWFSGQEIAVRIFAWLFALDILLRRSARADKAAETIATALAAGATHIEHNINYARLVVNNSHLLSEALALYVIGALLTELPRSVHWRRLGREILDEEADRQVSEDGGYIIQSHNYHRVTLRSYLLGMCIRQVEARPAVDSVAARDGAIAWLSRRPAEPPGRTASRWRQRWGAAVHPQHPRFRRFPSHSPGHEHRRAGRTAVRRRPVG